MTTTKKFLVIGRKAWKARPPRETPTRDNWKDGVAVIVHHTADNYTGGTRTDEFEHMREMQDFHQRNVDDKRGRGRGWNDIAYNFVIFPSGDVIEGRGFQVRGAGALDHNTDVCHIAFAGNFTTRKPTAAALAAYVQLRKRLATKGYEITSTKPHSAVNATACPGDGVRHALSLR